MHTTSRVASSGMHTKYSSLSSYELVVWIHFYYFKRVVVLLCIVDSMHTACIVITAVHTLVIRAYYAYYESTYVYVMSCRCY